MKISGPHGKLSRQGRGYQFHPGASEVEILDYRGRTLWRHRQWEGPSPIRWDGVDMYGNDVLTGDYLCKMTLPDNETHYIPFVYEK
jgi:hypothetical protein